jgi:hypothetical protein
MGARILELEDRVEALEATPIERRKSMHELEARINTLLAERLGQ